MSFGSGRSGGGSSRSAGNSHRRLILDTYSTLAEVTDALQRNGVESSNLVVAIDYTTSNTTQGRHTHGGHPLHDIAWAGHPTPYIQCLSIIARTLDRLDEDGMIPTYGFGCSRTHDDCVFSFLPGDAPCEGLGGVVRRYRELTPSVRLAGPTTFAPVIYKAIEAVAATGRAQFHILVILTDGQITHPEGLEGKSQWELETEAAIVAASHFPLSIVVIGVGDGPWDKMVEFDDDLPVRAFDNFQFCEHAATLRKAALTAPATEPERQHYIESQFAVAALQEVPEQYREMVRLKLLGCSTPAPFRVRTLEPPAVVPGPLPGAAPPPAPAAAAAAAAAPPAAAAARGGGGGAPEAALCVICLDAPADSILLPCGHKSYCLDHAQRIVATTKTCAICRHATTGAMRIFG